MSDQGPPLNIEDLVRHVEEETIPKATRTAQRVGATRRRKWRWFWAAVILLAVGGLALFLGTLIPHNNKLIADKNGAQATASALAPVATQGVDLAKQLNTLCQNDAFLKAHPAFCVQASSLATAAVTPVPGPQGSPGAQGSPGKTGATGPSGPAGQNAIISQAQANLAMASFCQANGCAPKLTVSQALEALTTYCNSNGQCKGPKGDTGANGTNGTNGANGTDGSPGAQGQQGDTGPAPTDEQVHDAAVAICSEDPSPCQGPTGPEGKPGADPTTLSFAFDVPNLIGDPTHYTVTCVWNTDTKAYDVCSEATS